MSDLSFEDKKSKRQEASRALPDAFWSWVENTITIPTTNEKLTKALNYSLNHKKELDVLLQPQDGYGFLLILLMVQKQMPCFIRW